MQDHCQTISIKGQDGNELRINATDFKPGEHELYVTPSGKSDDKPTEPAADAGNGQPAAAPAQQPAGQPRGAAKPA